MFCIFGHRSISLSFGALPDVDKLRANAGAFAMENVAARAIADASIHLRSGYRVVGHFFWGHFTQGRHIRSILNAQLPRIWHAGSRNAPYDHRNESRIIWGVNKVRPRKTRTL
jgi:hypothetical protein